MRRPIVNAAGFARQVVRIVRDLRLRADACVNSVSFDRHEDGNRSMNGIAEVPITRADTQAKGAGVDKSGVGHTQLAARVWIVGVLDDPPFWPLLNNHEKFSILVVEMLAALDNGTRCWGEFICGRH